MMSLHHPLSINILGMMIVVLLSTIITVHQIIAADENIKSLCDDPVIHTADRLQNNTYRVYRSRHYWILTGLPKKPRADGPFPIPYVDMPTLTKDMAIASPTRGALKDQTLLYMGTKYMRWTSDGKIKDKETNWSQVPGYGIQAAYVDGDLSPRPDTYLTMFQAKRVYYLNYTAMPITTVGNKDGYVGGQFNEHFPDYATAVMPFKSDDPSYDYHLYFFSLDRYCYRPVIGVQGCEWRDSRELFGCLDTGSPTSPSDTGNGAQASDGPSKQPPGNGAYVSTKHYGLFGLIAVLTVVLSISMN